MYIAVRILKWVGGRMQCQRRAERRVDVAVLAVSRPCRALIVQAGLDALAPGRADVLKEAGADRRCDTVYIVVQIGSEHTRVPGKAAGSFGCAVTAHSPLGGVRDHLFQVGWIAGQA